MPSRPTISIIGAGPAGGTAALAALQAGAGAILHEQSRLPRHKVCGEFLSPQIAPLLEQLSVWQSAEALRPARIERMRLCFSRVDRSARLPEPAFGLSRHALDALLLDAALAQGASLIRERCEDAPRPLVRATGRWASPPRGNRLFGFKAHFEGPLNDAVELYFHQGCYVGVNGVEGGRTNVCGLGPEEVLQEHGFEIDSFLHGCVALRERLAPLTRCWPWLSAGPLVFQNRFREPAEPGVYLTGDALSFVDPFTGSGLLSAVATGKLAGTAAAEGWDSERYRSECARALQRAFRVSDLFRWAVQTGWAESLVRWVPGQVLFRLTRPHVA